MTRRALLSLKIAAVVSIAGTIVFADSCVSSISKSIYKQRDKHKETTKPAHEKPSIRPY